MLTIRSAEPDDAAAIAALLIRSIREVCGPDYDNDERLLAQWCANKTPDNIARWTGDPNSYWIVALADDTIAGTASMTLNGDIKLCYVLPEYLHRGIGKAMLEQLLQQARLLGLHTLRLESTRTAREFYKRNGFIETGMTLGMGIIPSYAMERDLTTHYA